MHCLSSWAKFPLLTSHELSNSCQIRQIPRLYKQGLLSHWGLVSGFNYVTGNRSLLPEDRRTPEFWLSLPLPGDGSPSRRSRSPWWSRSTEAGRTAGSCSRWRCWRPTRTRFQSDRWDRWKKSISYEAKPLGLWLSTEHSRWSWIKAMLRLHFVSLVVVFL